MSQAVADFDGIRCPEFALTWEPLVASVKTWSATARATTSGSTPSPRNVETLSDAGKGNEIAVQPHRYRETSKRCPTGDGPEVVVAFPPRQVAVLCRS